MKPVHPREILRDELDELGLSANVLSKVLGVPVSRVTMILNRQRGGGGERRHRPCGLARYFGDNASTLAEFAEDLGGSARRKSRWAHEIARCVTPRPAAATHEVADARS